MMQINSINFNYNTKNNNSVAFHGTNTSNAISGQIIDYSTKSSKGLSKKIGLVAIGTTLLGTLGYNMFKPETNSEYKAYRYIPKK